MASDLQLKVVLSALDKASAPLSRINSSSSAVGKALKATTDRMKELNVMQRDVGAFKNYQSQLASTGTALQEARAKIGALERATESHRQAQLAIAAETNVHRQAVRNLQREMVRAKEPSAELSRQYTLAKDNLTKLETKYKGSQSQMRRYKQDMTETTAKAAGLNGKHQELSQRLTEVKGKLDSAGISTDRLGDHEQALADGLERSNKLLEAQKNKLKALGELKAKGANVRAAGGQVMDRGRSLATQGAVAGAAGGYLFKTQFLDRAAEFEKYQTILKTVTGSEKKAAEAMSWVSDFAARTPYELSDVLESFTRLKAYGIDPMADGMLKTLGDTASAMGKPVMQAVEAMADAVTGENERLKEFGIKGSKSGGQITYEYTNAAGDTLTKSVDASNRKLIQSTLSAIWNEKYAGAMDDQSKTWSGMVSNMSDQWARFTNMAMSAGLFDRMKERLAGVLAQLDKMAANGQLEAWATKLGTGMLKFADGLWKAGSALASMSSSVANAVGGWQNLVYILAALKLVPLAVSLVSLTTALYGAGVALGGFIGGSALFVKAGALIAGAVRTVSIGLWGLALNPVFLVIAAAVAVLAGAAYLIWRNWDTLGPKFAAMWEGIKAVFVLGTGQIVGFFTNALGQLAAMPEKFADLGVQLMLGLARGITNALGAVKSAVTGAGAQAIGWFKEKLGIHSPSRVFAELGGYTMSGLAQGLTNGQDGALKALRDTTKRMTSATGAVALGVGAATLGSPALASQSPLSFDSRPPLSAAQGAAQGNVEYNATFIIHAAPGMNEQVIADLVGRKFEEMKRRDATRLRGRLHDNE